MTHGVVLGASLAGLVHAAALAHRCDRVTLVERDALPTVPAQRPGVSQGHHLHLLAPGGVARLQQLLPGIEKDLTAGGGHAVAAPEWRFLMGGGRLDLSASSDLRIVGATRPLIERVVRDRVLTLAGVELLDGCSARALTTTEDRARVTGVRLRDEGGDGPERVLAADLVVDTTGRGSASPRWLTELGYTRPEEQRLTVGVHYTTRLFHRDSADLGGCRQVLIDIPPGERRGGAALAVEDDRWLVTLIGMAGERPPGDLAGFVDYSAELWAPDLHEIVAGAAPIGEPTRHAFPAFSWRRYDRLPELPGGYAVSGDAVCSLDPRFAQGMTVATAEAMALGRLLDRHGLDRIGPRLVRATRSVVQDAWDLATGSDLANPLVEGPRPLAWRLTNAYLERLVPVAHHDPHVAAALVRVIGMVDRPPQLMRPLILRRVLSAGLPVTSRGHRRHARPARRHRSRIDARIEPTNVAADLHAGRDHT